MPVSVRRVARALGPCLSALALLAFVSALGCPAARAETPVLLLLAQPEPGPGDFVDMTYHLEPALRESGKFQVIAFKPALPAIRAALDDKRLSTADLAPPITKDAAHRIARVVGANRILYVTSRYTREGLATQAELEAAVQGDAWNAVVSTRLEPLRGSRRKLGLAEGVHLHTAQLVQQLTGAPGSKPVAVPLGPPAKGGPAKQAGQPSGARDPSGTDKPAPPPGGPAPPPGAPVAGPTVGAAAVPEVDYRARIERARRNNDEAGLIVALRRAINEKPADAALRRDLIEAYRSRGWLDAAREEAQRAVVLAPGDAGLHRALGACLGDAGDPAAALAEYQEAARLAPKDAEGLVALGDALWNVAKPDDALKAYQDAAQADAKTSVPHRRLARLYVQKDRFTECAAEMAAAARLSAPDDPDLRADQAQLLLSVDGGLADVLARMAASRKGVSEGTRTREVAFQEVTAGRKRAEALGGFLDALPGGPLGRVQALYAQAATLTVQAAEGLLQDLETRSSVKDDETTLLRLEAAKQLSEAGRQLKALVSPKPAAR